MPSGSVSRSNLLPVGAIDLLLDADRQLFEELHALLLQAVDEHDPEHVQEHVEFLLDQQGEERLAERLFEAVEDGGHDLADGRMTDLQIVAARADPLVDVGPGDAHRPPFDLVAALAPDRLEFGPADQVQEVDLLACDRDFRGLVGVGLEREEILVEKLGFGQFARKLARPLDGVLLEIDREQRAFDFTPYAAGSAGLLAGHGNLRSMSSAARVAPHSQTGAFVSRAEVRRRRWSACVASHGTFLESRLESSDSGWNLLK